MFREKYNGGNGNGKKKQPTITQSPTTSVTVKLSPGSHKKFMTANPGSTRDTETQTQYKKSGKPKTDVRGNIKQYGTYNVPNKPAGSRPSHGEFEGKHGYIPVKPKVKRSARVKPVNAKKLGRQAARAARKVIGGGGGFQSARRASR